MKPKFKIGQRVRLKPDKQEGWVEEFGTYDGKSGKDCCIVTLESEYLNDSSDDGLREVSLAQIESILKETTMKTATKSFGKKKVVEAVAEEAAEKQAKKAAPAAVSGAVKRGPKVRKSGRRGRLYAAVPAKGSIRVKELLAQAEDLKIERGAISGLVAKMVKSHYLEQV